MGIVVCGWVFSKILGSEWSQSGSGSGLGVRLIGYGFPLGNPNSSSSAVVRLLDCLKKVLCTLLQPLSRFIIRYSLFMECMVEALLDWPRLMEVGCAV